MGFSYISFLVFPYMYCMPLENEGIKITESCKLKINGKRHYITLINHGKEVWGLAGNLLRILFVRIRC